MTRGFEDCEVATWVRAANAVDPFIQDVFWDRNAGLGEDMVVVVGFYEPCDVLGFDVHRHSIQLFGVAGLAGGDEIKDVVGAAGTLREIVVNAEGAHFEGLAAEVAGAMLTVKEIMAVDGDVFSRGHGSPAFLLKRWILQKAAVVYGLDGF